MKPASFLKWGLSMCVTWMAKRYSEGANEKIRTICPMKELYGLIILKF